MVGVSSLGVAASPLSTVGVLGASTSTTAGSSMVGVSSLGVAASPLSTVGVLGASTSTTASGSTVGVSGGAGSDLIKVTSSAPVANIAGTTSGGGGGSDLTGGLGAGTTQASSGQPCEITFIATNPTPAHWYGDAIRVKVVAKRVCLTVGVYTKDGWVHGNGSASPTFGPAEPPGYTGTFEFTVPFTYDTNPQTKARTATIWATNGYASATLTLVQEPNPYGAPPATVSLSTTSVTAGAVGGSNSSVVWTNQSSWTASSSQSWLTVSPSSGANGGYFVVTTAPNSSQSSRTGTVTVRAGDASTTLTVTQAGTTAPATVSLTPLGWGITTDLPATGSGVNMFVGTNQASWTASSGQPWLILSRSSGVSGDLLSVTVAPNTGKASRSGVVTVSAGGATTTLTISQLGAA